MTDTPTPPQQPRAVRSRWGRVRAGDRRVPALLVALPVAIVLAAALGALVMATGAAGEPRLAGGVAVAVITLWPLAGLVWALVVDRTTLAGATARPEQSIESAWYERAASGAFSDTVVVVGLAAAAIAFTGLDVPVLLALSGVIVVAAGSVTVRYLAQHRRA